MNKLSHALGGCLLWLCAGAKAWKLMAEMLLVLADAWCTVFCTFCSLRWASCVRCVLHVCLVIFFVKIPLRLVSHCFMRIWRNWQCTRINRPKVKAMSEEDSSFRAHAELFLVEAISPSMMLSQLMCCDRGLFIKGAQTILHSLCRSSSDFAIDRLFLQHTAELIHLLEKAHQHHPYEWRYQRFFFRPDRLVAESAKSLTRWEQNSEPLIRAEMPFNPPQNWGLSLHPCRIQM